MSENEAMSEKPKLQAIIWHYEDRVLPDGRMLRTPVLDEGSREAFEEWRRTDPLAIEIDALAAPAAPPPEKTD